MSNYIARLLGQSGLSVRGAAPQRPAESPARESVTSSSASADLAEISTERDSGAPSAGDAGVNQPNATRQSPAASAVSATRTNVSAQTAQTAGPLSERGVAANVSDATVTQASAPAPATMSEGPPNDARPVDDSEDELFREVMSWVGTNNGSAPAGDTSAVPEPASPSGKVSPLPAGLIATSAREIPVLTSNPTSAAIVTEPAESASPAQRGAANQPSQLEPPSVHIGTIHLTIEAPPEKASAPPPAAAARPTPAPAARTPDSSAPGSRLRRHYLRPY